MSVLSVLKYVTQHPLNERNKISAIVRFLKWQLNTRLNNHPILYPFTERAKLVVCRGMTGATGNLYCGLHEFADMAFLLHFLRPSDLFVDIGSNVGSYTVLASAHCKANAYAFEPLPATFNWLSMNIAVNSMSDKVKAFNMALGAEKGTIAFTNLYDTANHVAAENEKNTVNVPISTLDDALDGATPSLIKIDVEGFEMQVVKGGEETLGKDRLKAIIVEFNSSGKRYGFDDNETHHQIMDYGFRPFEYNVLERDVKPLKTFNYKTSNTLYLRDVDFVRERLKTAEAVKVLNQVI